MATGKGVVRFDGTHYRSFPFTGECSREGTQIAEDSYGRIWYQNFDGHLLYLERDTFRQWGKFVPAGFYLFGMSGETLFCVGREAIILIDLKTLTAKETISLQAQTLIATASDKQGYHVLHQSHEIIYPDGERKTLPFSEKLNPNNAAIFLPYQSGYAFAYKQNGSDGISIHAGGETRKVTLKGKPFIQNISETKKDIWICTPAGGYRIAKTGDEPPELWLQGMNISDVLQDREGNIWFATLENGIVCMPIHAGNLIPTPFQPDKLRPYLPGWALIGTSQNELLTLNLENGQFQSLFKGSKNIPLSMLEYLPENEKIYFSSDSFRILTKEGKSYASYNMAIKDVEPAGGALMIAGSGFVSALIPPGTTLADFPHLYKNSKQVIAPIAGRVEIVTQTRAKNILCTDSARTCYAGTGTGLLKITQNKVTEVLYENKPVISRNMVSAGNNIFILTIQGKLLTIINDRLQAFSDVQNLIPGEIEFIQAYQEKLVIQSQNNFWIYTISNREIQKIISPVIGGKINDYMLNGDQIIFSTNKGIIIQNLEKQGNPTKPTFVLESVSSEYQQLFPGEEFFFPRNENSITLNYAVIHYQPEITPRLEYQVNQSEWEELPNELRMLHLASLAPGQYEVKFRFVGDTEKCGMVSFEIHKPFWLELWFNVFILAAGMIAFWIYYRWQIGLLQTRNKLLMDKMELEQNLNESILTSIRSQMNPHFFYNALNTIQSYIVSDDKKNATTYLSKFARLTRTILEMSGKETVLLKDELTAIRLYLDIEKARFSDDFVFEIIVDAQIEPDATRIPSMLLQPYIENAIKHGLLHKKGEKHLRIEFRKETDGLYITIEDNGIGRKKSGEINQQRPGDHRSFATDASSRRLAILNKGKENPIQLSIIDKTDPIGIPCGTLIQLVIPQPV